MIRYQLGGLDLLDSVGPLWIKLRNYHAERSTWFSDVFRTKPWEKRRRELKAKAENGGLRVSLVVQDDADGPVGYCVSTLDGSGIGEIDSLYVDPELRGEGIASSLIEDHLAWLRNNTANPIRLYVAEGNEGVMELYRRFGFRHHSLSLQLTADWQHLHESNGLIDRSGTPELIFGVGSLERLPAIEPLWLALREHHIRTSPHFSDQFVERDFDQEKLALMHTHRKGAVAIHTVATPSGILMGYCIAAKTATGVGLIESLYIRPEIRGVGAGVKLIVTAVHWLQNQRCEKIRVRVAVGNEESAGVYEKAGFHLASHIMEIVG
ncbi:GNAT family N-acetyltransferase [bacterium]|nr:GNAT family N-acetyltransferase [bacterium]